MKLSHMWRWGALGSLALLLSAFALGTAVRGAGPTVSVIVPSVFLEVVAGATASVPLGFDPVTGALVSSLANMAPVPLLLTAFDAVVRKWKWLGRRLEKSRKIGEKYGKYGVWVLAPLAPVIGVYLSVAVGIGLKFRLVLIFISTGIGVVASGFLTTLGGEGIRRLLEL